MNIAQILNCFSDIFNSWYIFPVELLSAFCLFSYWLKKRPGFLLRVILSLLLIFGCSYMWKSSEPGIFQMLQYFIIFTLSSLCTYFIYTCTLWHAFYCGVAAYATQHLANSISNIFMYFFPWNLLRVNELTSGSLAFRFVVFIIVFCLVYLFTFFVISAKIKKDGFYGIHNKYFSIFILVMLIFVIVLNYIRIYYVDSHSLSQILFSLYSSIGCIFALVIISGINQQSKLINSLEIANQLINLQKKQYKMSEENINIINAKCHDLKYQLKAFRQKLTNPELREFSKELESAVQIYDSVVKTDNEAVNIILTEKSLYCQKYHIELSCMIDSTNLGFISVSDLYSILGNLLDNAIESVMQIDNIDKRIIGFTISTNNQMVVIHTENYFCHPVDFVDGLPVTTKSDRDYHGYGMKSIQLLAEKYNGTLSVVTDDDIFNVDLMIPFTQQRSVKSS